MTLREQFVLDTRQLKTKDEQHEFKFLIVDKPERWLPHSSFESSHILRFPGSNTALEIPIRGISYSQWSEIEKKYLIPTPDQDKLDDNDYMEKHTKDRENVLNHRQVALFELSTGKLIPGENDQEKINWLENNIPAGEADNLFTHIINTYSNVGNDGEFILESYNNVTNNTNGSNVIKFDGFDDWLKASDVGCVYRMQRSFEDFIIEFPLKKITEGKKKIIEEETKPPSPPWRPGKNKVTGILDPAIKLYDYSSPTWREASLAVSKKRIIMQLEATLPFDIPGNDINEKYKWIGDRLMGDVLKLVNFIENELLSYRGRLSFF